MTALVARPLPQRRLTGQRHALVATAHVRLMMLMLLLTAGFALVVGRIAMLGLMSEPATARGDATSALPRGDILDRNGEPLARTIEAWTIGVHPRRLLGDRHDIAAKLAAAMPEHEEAWYYARLIMPVNFTYLDRHASPALVNAIHAIGEPGIVFAREPERLYPQTTLAANVLGFLDQSGKGKSGMEEALNDRFTGAHPDNSPITLSVDVRVQAAMESELGHAMTAFKAKGAAGVVLDVATGEVIALASFPTFNPNKPGDAPPPQTDESGHQIPGPFYNRLTSATYELGSTFKPITMAIAIDTGVVTSMARRFDATVPLVVGKYTIHDHDGQNRFLDIPETLVHSSNIATARIADEVGAERMQKMFRALNFDKPVAIDLPERGWPRWPSYWARTTVMTTAYGHGIAVTPMHLASAYAALVNGGIWRPATLMKVAPGHANAGRRVISQATSDRMRQLLRLVVLQGTGRKGDAIGYRVGGKTGTAEVASGGSYSKKSNVSTFAAAFPMDAPRYVVVAMIDSPQRTAESAYQATAAWTVAPVVSRVILRTGTMLGVAPDATRDVDVSELLPLLWHAPGEDSTDPE